jgi:GNAT superfamily N-acetyltransferase
MATANTDKYRTTTLFITVDGKSVAEATLKEPEPYLRELTYLRHELVEITDLYTTSQSRGKGYATALMRAALSMIEHAGRQAVVRPVAHKRGRSTGPNTQQLFMWYAELGFCSCAADSQYMVRR